MPLGLIRGTDRATWTLRLEVGNHQLRPPVEPPDDALRTLHRGTDVIQHPAAMAPHQPFVPRIDVMEILAALAHEPDGVAAVGEMDVLIVLCQSTQVWTIPIVRLWPRGRGSLRHGRSAPRSIKLRP